MKLLVKMKNGFKAAKRIILIVCACILAVAIVVVTIFSSINISPSVKGALFGNSEFAAKTTGKFSDDSRAPLGMKLVCENSELAFFNNETDGKLAVLDKKTGNYWNTNPENPTSDSIATGSLIDRMRSVFEITYYNSNDTSAALNTYKYSVQNDSLKYEFIENGVRVIYQLGDNKVTRSMLPAVVDKNKFEKNILSKLSEEEKTTVSQYYKLQSISSMKSTVTAKTYRDLYTSINENKEYYFLDQYTPEYKLEPLYSAICGTAKYTADDVKEDNKKVGYSVTVDTFVQFVIPVEYTIENNSFVVSIPASEIQVPGGLYLTEISLLPFFGSAGIEDNGYMLVPDGSGAIVNFNNGRKTSYSYTVPVYGVDKAIREVEASFNTASANIPVFGIVYENSKAMLGIIEEGEAHATVNTQISGVDNEQNYIYTTFNLTPMDVEEVTDAKFDVSSNLYQEEQYKGRFTLRYFFTGSDEADYSSLANIYRDYLRENGVLKESDNKQQLSLKMVGKVEKETSFIGIPYKTAETVTTFNQATEIVNKLKGLDVTNINVGFTSWFGGGIRHSAVTGKVSLTGDLGGKKGLKKLNLALDNKSSLSLGADLLMVYRSFPKFNQFTNGVRFLNNEIAQGYFYDLATWQPSERENEYYYLSSRYAKSVIEDYTKSVNKLDVNGLWFGDVGNTLNSDFKPDNNIDRELSKQLIKEALAPISEKNTLTFNNPNGYVFAYTDNAVNLPVKSSENVLVNESVPFLQMVLSGSMRYSGGAFNRSGSSDGDFLKAVETGADIYYEWIYMSDVEVSALKGIETEKLYSMCYNGWLETAVKQYNRIKKELDTVSGQEILGHCKIMTNVYRTDYKNGSVIVNYNYDDITVDGVTVKARDFKLVNREGK